MEESALKAHIAYSAGQPKSAAVMTGTGAVVELLRRSGAIEERDGKLVVLSEESLVQDKIIEKIIERPIHSEPVSNANYSKVDISIKVIINCSVDEIDALRSKLSDLLSDVSSLNADRADSEE